MAAYSYVMDAFRALNVQVYALSVDSIAVTQALSDRLQLDLPLVCELKYPDDVDLIGAYRHPSRKSHQATAFVLDAEHKVESSVYSTTNIGRLMPEEVLRTLS